MWRVGYVLVIYGIFYGAAKEVAPFWLLALLMPLYMLFKPPGKDLCETHPKVLSDGMIFYVFKWGLITIGGTVAVFLMYGLQYGADIIMLLKAVLNNMFICVPILLSVIISWFVNDKNYLKVCSRKKQSSHVEGKKKVHKKKS